MCSVCVLYVSVSISQPYVCFFGTCKRVKLIERVREKQVELCFVFVCLFVFTTLALKRYFLKLESITGFGLSS